MSTQKHYAELAAYEQNAQRMQNTHPYPPQTYAQSSTAPSVVVSLPSTVPYAGIRDHLVWSIFNLILLCPVLGVVAVIFSALSRSAKSSGQWEEAKKHGQVAFGLNVAGTVLGVIVWIIAIAVIALTAGTLASVGGGLKDLGSLDFGSVTDSGSWSWNLQDTTTSSSMSTLKPTTTAWPANPWQ